MDEKYMALAVELAKKGAGKVNPNPLVGAVIVKDGEIIGEGYHEKFGQAHGEVNAFKNAIKDVVGATMYVTLEPCSHYGKTPPCTDKIIENKISRVVIGTLDPNSLVSGRGVKKLKESGIEVVVGVLEKECKKLNEVFLKYITKKIPFVVLKTAMSLDGKIALESGESKWITGDSARSSVHKLRNSLEAIMVGVNTVIKDNPELTCRIDGGRNPIRIIVDSNLRIPMESRVLRDKKARTIIATTEFCDKSKLKELESLGIEVIRIKDKNKRVDLKELMIKLGDMSIDGILLEGGAELNFSALEEGIVDKVQVFIAPKLLGGKFSKTPVEGRGIEVLDRAFKLSDVTIGFVSEDIVIEGYLNLNESNLSF